LLLSDGIAEEFASLDNRKRSRKVSIREASTKSGDPNRISTQQPRSAREVSAPIALSVDGEALAARLKEWRTGEAKRLRVPPYCILHDRTLTAVASARPTSPRQLIEIGGIGPAKVEKFGPAILEICGARF